MPIASAKPSSATPPNQLSIEIGGTGSKPYKSIEAVAWDDVPPFAVLTGLNGSGKTQILEFLAYRLSETRHPADINLSETHLVTTDKFGAGSVVYVPGGNILSDTSIGIEQIRQLPLQQLRSLQQGRSSPQLTETAKHAWFQRWLVENKLTGRPEAEIAAKLPSDLSYMLDETNVISGLAHVFQSHYLKRAQKLVKQADGIDTSEEIGIPPWVMLNDALATAEFPYAVVSPVETELHLHYTVQFRRVGSQTKILPSALSSGEQAIVKLFSWLFYTKNYARAPKLFLLDEPDAHLHPSLTRQFMAILKDVLVDQYGIRVVITTHSPSTVALAPEGSVFEMSQPRIMKSPSISHTVGLLTSGLMIVSNDTKFVFVEDNEDVDFYHTLWEILTDTGPSKVANAIPPTPSVVFISASIGRGVQKVAGGCSVVIKHVEKFEQDPLCHLFSGVIDADECNVATPRVKVIGRYSIENYLIDPLVVYALLNEEGISPVVEGINISRGDEHLIRAMPQDKLQTIANAIFSVVETQLKLGHFTLIDAELKRVEFSTDVALMYPNWMFSFQGHDLLRKFQSSFGHQAIQPPKLYKQLRRVRLIPVELVQLMRALQS